jgi:hypothetical protein
MREQPRERQRAAAKQAEKKTCRTDNLTFAHECRELIARVQYSANGD